MRILLAMAVVVVFAALLVFDTAALARLTVVCITGGCGVHPMWIAIGGAGLAFAALLSVRRPQGNLKSARAKKTGSSRPPRGKAVARRKPKQAK